MYPSNSSTFCHSFQIDEKSITEDAWHHRVVFFSSLRGRTHTHNVALYTTHIYRTYMHHIKIGALRRAMKSARAHRDREMIWQLKDDFLFRRRLSHATTVHFPIVSFSAIVLYTAFCSRGQQRWKTDTDTHVDIYKAAVKSLDQQSQW